MLIKVCGMKDAEQVREIEDAVDFVGFIFYKGSKRFIKSSPRVENTKKVGVFVNASVEEILDRIESEQLEYVQLHGSESSETCAILRSHVGIIKAFGVDSSFDFKETSSYEGQVDFFLFDTKTSAHGGSGQLFDWSILEKYQGETPFFLSGGISPNALDAVRTFQHPRFVGLDLNSGFEFSPGDKNCEIINDFISEIRK